MPDRKQIIQETLSQIIQEAKYDRGTKEDREALALWYRKQLGKGGDREQRVKQLSREERAKRRSK
jgi:hypothetical protein